MVGHWLVGWLVSWLVSWLVDWSVGQSVGSLSGRPPRGGGSWSGHLAGHTLRLQ